jgi:ribosome maturation factor RimP
MSEIQKIIADLPRQANATIAGQVLAITAVAVVKNSYTLGVYTRSGLCPLFLFLGPGVLMDATITRVWLLAAPLAEGEGMEIVDIEFRHEGSRGGRILRLYLDKEGGTNVDDLTRVSRQLSELLDAQDTIDGAYTLEVSSPGINRPLKKPEHFARFIGKRIRIRTRDMIDGRRSFLGILGKVVEDSVTLTQEGKQYLIPFSMIEKSNYEHDWSA